ncbi:hypothetical protein C8Q77DRAFT_273329 [Trametes polyzona]|nr:hypothetical protein C8Q77DRAFT_273329 [Trametes polyzona]
MSKSVVTLALALAYRWWCTSAASRLKTVVGLLVPLETSRYCFLAAPDLGLLAWIQGRVDADDGGGGCNLSLLVCKWSATLPSVAPARIPAERLGEGVDILAINCQRQRWACQCQIDCCPLSGERARVFVRHGSASRI